jgi:hypothetical protein
VKRLAALALLLCSCAPLPKSGTTPVLENPKAREIIARFVLCMLEPAPEFISAAQVDARDAKTQIVARFAYCLKTVLSATATVTTVESQEAP